MADASIPLIDMFPGLAESAPRLAIGNWPTPVAPLSQFAAASGLSSLFVKNEAVSHPECGGSKVRNLEFLLAEAQRRGARTVLTIGAVGSHHVRATGWHARRLGISTTAIVIPQPPAAYVRCNVRVGCEAGVCFVPANYATLIPKLAWHLARLRLRDGQPPFFIPPGGTTPMSSFGHVNAALELRRQIDDGLLPAPDYLFVPLGSLGTAAGLSVGLALAGLETKVVGVTAYSRWLCSARRWSALAHRIVRELHRRGARGTLPAIHPSELVVVHDALGRGYAHFTETAIKVAERLLDLDGLLLDGTYSAKAFSGMLAYVDRMGLQNARLLFWNTYGPPRPSANASPEPPRSLHRRLHRYFRENQPLDRSGE